MIIFSYFAESDIYNFKNIWTNLILFSVYYKCSKCEKEYSKESSLIYHLNYDCGKPVLVCCFGYCSKRISRRSSMKRHMMKHNVTDWEKYVKIEEIS